MGLSLAQNSRKSRIGTDPRNTQWANNTDRFGHQQLVKMGWKPGRGLGASVEGAKEHVKVTIKTDAKGLGHQKGQVDQPTGLDVFQRILGKLNGNEEEVEKQIEKKQRQTGLYMHFVPGGVLEGTVKTKAEKKSEKKEEKKSETKSKSERKSERKSAEKEKKKIEKQAEKLKKEEKQLKKESPADPAPRPRASARGIRATRNKYIEMKRKATADSQGLKEILML